MLVEMFDGVGMVGAWALHELMEVARKVLLGLFARVISRGNRRSSDRSPSPDGPGPWAFNQHIQRASLLQCSNGGRGKGKAKCQDQDEGPST